MALVSAEPSLPALEASLTINIVFKSIKTVKDDRKANYSREDLLKVLDTMICHYC